MARMQFEAGDTRVFSHWTPEAMLLLKEAGFPLSEGTDLEGKPYVEVTFSSQGEWDVEPCNGVWYTKHTHEKIDAYWMVIEERGAKFYWNSASGVLDVRRDDEE